VSTRTARAKTLESSLPTPHNGLDADYGQRRMDPRRHDGRVSGLHNSNTVRINPLLKIYTTRLNLQRPEDVCFGWQTFGGQIATSFAVLAAGFDFSKAPTVSTNNHAETPNPDPPATHTCLEAQVVAAATQGVAAPQDTRCCQSLSC
jgi:hypothetical protein